VQGGRSAVFVDVGYLLGTAGRTLLNTTYRHYIRCDYRSLVAGVVAKVEEHSGMPVLRVYWYDAAYNAVPTYEQRSVATIPGVKLRLGRLVQGRQKGVDSLIVRDLMTLARERAMATAYLITGDEDVREGVVAAQDMGARVVLLGLPSAHRAFTLLAEADEELVLPDGFWRPHFSVLTPTQMEAELPAELAAAEPSPEVVAPAAPAAVTANGSAAAGASAEADGESFEAAAADAGADFAREWGHTADIEEIRRVLAMPAWRVPPYVDGQLLVVADRELGFLREHPELKGPLRRGFKGELVKTLAEREAAVRS
jgi:hypothetical protein